MDILGFEANLWVHDTCHRPEGEVVGHLFTAQLC